MEAAPESFCKLCGANRKGKRFCPSCGADSQEKQAQEELSVTTTPGDGPASSGSLELETVPPSEPLLATGHPAASPAPPESLPPSPVSGHTGMDTPDLPHPEKMIPVSTQAEFCKSCGAALGGKRFCPQCGAENRPVAKGADGQALPQPSTKRLIWIILAISLLAICAVGGYFAYEYWTKPLSSQAVTVNAVSKSPVIGTTAKATTTTSPSVTNPTSAQTAQGASVAPQSASSAAVQPVEKKTPNVVETHSPIAKAAAITHPPLRPVAPGVRPEVAEQAAISKSAPSTESSTKEQMQKILSPFGGTN
ncbi:MAG: hypothetical protein JJ693_00835 [Acidithiobacillus sp.]|nr:hypothetical protein [Acidithiobacillus sp.]